MLHSAAQLPTYEVYFPRPTIHLLWAFSALSRPLDGRLVYVGRVGTGFKDAQLRALRKQLGAATVREPPADLTLMERKDRAEARWSRPELVVEVYYQGLGSSGLLRQPAFKALRSDKRVGDL